MNALFLSAGVPDQPSRGPYLETSDPIAIRDAVRAVAGTALGKGYDLVFGGHPAISPLVWQVAESMGKGSAVTIYQSREFEGRIPPEALAFSRFFWVDRGADREESLARLRTAMLTSRPFALGVFIGGMDGVEAELKLFRAFQPQAPVLPVFTTGGAARTLWETDAEAIPAELRERLRSDRSYRSLFLQALSREAER